MRILAEAYPTRTEIGNALSRVCGASLKPLRIRLGGSKVMTKLLIRISSSQAAIDDRPKRSCQTLLGWLDIAPNY